MDQFAFLITLQWKTPEGVTTVNTVDGTVDPIPGISRLQLTRDVINYAKDKLGTSNEVAVLFLYLEPNQL